MFGGSGTLPDAVAAVGERLPFGAAVAALSAAWVGAAVDPAHLISLGVATVIGVVTAALLFRWD